MMNFDGLDPGMGEYPPRLHGTLDAGMETSLDPHLNPGLLQGVELDPEGLTVTVPEPVHLMEGMFSELHSAVSEVGIPVTATHFDLQEEILWMGNHRVRASAVTAWDQRHSPTCSFLLGPRDLILRANDGPLLFLPSACHRRRTAHPEPGNGCFVPVKVQPQMPHSGRPGDV